MSSFRDRFNPEAVHFPSSLRSKILIVMGVLVIVLCLLPAFWIDQPLRPVLIDTLLAAAAVGFLLASWPASLITDQFGVTRQTAFPRRKVFIAWKDVASVEARQKFGGFLSGLGIESDSRYVYSHDGRVVVHGPEHGDRDRFLHELKIHGVAFETEAASGTERE